MNPEFWQQRWDNHQIGWHQPAVNPKLVQFFDQLPLDVKRQTAPRIFVPLCGKTLDIGWLAEQGCSVVGVELAESAVVQLFDELGAEPVITCCDKAVHYQTQYHRQNIDIWQGDIFDLTVQDIGRVDAVYDRAALVALADDAPSYLRTRYVQQLIQLSQTAAQLLLTFDFEPLGCPPPFLITSAMLDEYYGGDYSITLLDRQYSAKIASNGISGYLMSWLLMPK